MATSYEVWIERPAEKALAKIERKQREKIGAAIRALGEQPRPPQCTPLRGRAGWRIRVGDYRVIYDIHDTICVVAVVEGRASALGLYGQEVRVMDRVVPISEVRDNLGAFLEEAKDHEVFILKHGRPAGVLLSVEAYEKVLAALEDLEDANAALEAKLDPQPSQPFDEVMAELDA